MVLQTTAEGIAMFFRPHLRAAPEIDSRVDSSRLPIRRGVRSIGLPIWILIGAGAGLIAGVVLGERTAILKPLGSAYAMMLQVAVYPYLLCSLLWGLGRLQPGMARRLFAAGWGVYLEPEDVGWSENHAYLPSSSGEIIAPAVVFAGPTGV